MKKCFLNAYFLIFSIGFVFSQKNTFSVVYTPAITKLNTNYLAKNMALDLFYYWYTTRKPNKPMYGFNAGFMYGRQINHKLSLSTGLFYTELKQHTGNFYGDKEFDKPPITYLASELVFKYTGLELPISVSYLLTHAHKWDTKLEVGTSVNIMGYFDVQDYVIALKSGKEVGCCTAFLTVPTTFSNLSNKLSKAYFYRLGLFVGYEFDYNIHSNWQLSVTPLFKYYSNALKDKNAFGTLDADAYFLGLQSKINFKL